MLPLTGDWCLIKYYSFPIALWGHNQPSRPRGAAVYGWDIRQYITITSPPAVLQSLLPAAGPHHVTAAAVLQNTPELQPGDLTLAHVTLSRYQVDYLFSVQKVY